MKLLEEQNSQDIVEVKAATSHYYFFCKICNCSRKSSKDIKEHIRGREHQEKVKKGDGLCQLDLLTDFTKVLIVSECLNYEFVSYKKSHKINT